MQHNDHSFKRMRFILLPLIPRGEYTEAKASMILGRCGEFTGWQHLSWFYKDGASYTPIVPTRTSYTCVNGIIFWAIVGDYRDAAIMAIGFIRLALIHLTLITPGADAQLPLD